VLCEIVIRMHIVPNIVPEGGRVICGQGQRFEGVTSDEGKLVYEGKIGLKSCHYEI
jgi:hypothetical protein